MIVPIEIDGTQYYHAIASPNMAWFTERSSAELYESEFARSIETPCHDVANEIFDRYKIEDNGKGVFRYGGNNDHLFQTLEDTLRWLLILESL